MLFGVHDSLRSAGREARGTKADNEVGLGILEGAHTLLYLGTIFMVTLRTKLL